VTAAESNCRGRIADYAGNPTIYKKEDTMQRKWFVLFTTLVLFGLMIAPLGPAGAQSPLPPPPSPKNLSPEIEQARARQAMESVLAKYLAYWGPRYQLSLGEVTVDGEWAHGVTEWQSQTKTLSGPIHILAHRSSDGTWQALLPGADGAYLQWLEAMPERLMPASEKSQLRAQAAEANALRRPQTTPAVPPAASAMPLDKGGQGGPVEPIPSQEQPLGAGNLPSARAQGTTTETSIPPTSSTLTPTEDVQVLYGPDCSSDAYGYNQNSSFFTDVLNLMGIPVSQFALDAFAAWQPYENTQACWNPLATTYHVEWFPAGTGCTETIFNSAGVRNYSSKYCGELATARTLLYSGSGAWYKPIRDMLSQASFDWQLLHDSIKKWVGSESYATSITNKWKTLWDNRGGGTCEATSVPSGYTQCAEEGGYCSFSGMASVVYGANSCFTLPAVFSGGTNCSNDVFGDPLPGVHKYCYTNASSPPSCPQSGGVILYWNANYDCGNGSGDAGYRQRTSTGWQNVTDGSFNDKASSVRVPSGWSVMLYEHADRGGGKVCYNTDINDFGPQGNFPGTSVPINDQVSSIEVFSDANCGGATLPSAPTLSMPGNGNVYNEGASFTFFWNSASSATEYLAEYWGGPAGTLNSGWQSGTSWYIGSQWAGYTYYWHVKARNGAGASGWSDTWSFAVRPAAPSNLSAQTASCSQVNLYWTDNSGNEEGYKIYRNGTYVGQVGMNSTSYQDTGLNENTSYSYYVKAFRGSIESDASNTVDISTPTCAPPMPDLTPAQWGGWQYPIVPSSVTGTSVVNTLYANLPTYID